VLLEAVIQRRTDNATVERKKTNDSRQNTQQQTKIRIEQHELNQETG
jgi:hypothetical protein